MKSLVVRLWNKNNAQLVVAVNHFRNKQEEYPRLISGMMLATSLLMGTASFVLVDRNGAAAQWVLGALFFFWALLMLDYYYGGLRQRIKHPVFKFIGQYLSQVIHQESLFFVIPFLLITTSWQSPQAIFSGVVILAAILTSIDSLYFQFVANNKGLLLLYNSVSIFAVVLTVMPLVFGINTQWSFWVSAVVIWFLYLPYIARYFSESIHWKRFAWSALLLSTVLAFFYMIKPLVPPITLWVTNGVLTHSVNASSRAPGSSVNDLTAAELKRNGLYAFTPISAPFGIDETIYHDWYHEGKLIDSIVLRIRGGRKEGFRSWSRKQAFPNNPEGSWVVMVRTENKQLIAYLPFSVQP